MDAYYTLRPGKPVSSSKNDPENICVLENSIVHEI